ncbi:MAG TPA: pyridoxamine 5'-phosphate oxidase [Acidimicrobiales bacterium]
MDLSSYRAEFEAHGLGADELAADPMDQFHHWFAEAQRVGLHEPEAMVVSTVAQSGVPSSRFVLLRDAEAGAFTFFTNYGSQKSRELAENPSVAICFPWNVISRQIRVVGTAERASDEASDAYFATRPRLSQIGAWASTQSAELSGRDELERSLAEVEARFGDGDIPRPANWGGFRVLPHEFEFWQARPYRLHDRFRYRRADGGGWAAARLWP